MSISQGPGPLDDDSLVEAQHPMSSYPAFPAKQAVFGGAAIVLLITTFLPWWDAEIPLDRVNDTLNGWLLLTAGFSVGSLGAGTGYSWFGNVLFGLVPVVPAIALAVLLALRVLRLYVSPANLLSMYSILAAIGSVWLLLFGTLRTGAGNGVYPPMIGPWIVLIVSVLLAVLCRLWWRTERIHFPATRFLGFGRARRPQPQSSAAAAGDLFDGLGDEGGSDAELLSFGGDLRSAASNSAASSSAASSSATRGDAPEALSPIDERDDDGSDSRPRRD